jgi:hypothetical protein
MITGHIREWLCHKFRSYEDVVKEKSYLELYIGVKIPDYSIAEGRDPTFLSCLPI